MKFLLHFLVTAGVIYMIARYQYVPGIEVPNGYSSALIFAVILSIVNLVLGTILRIITFPIRLLTLGLFSIVITMVVIKVTTEVVPGTVVINGIGPLFAFAIVMTVTSLILKFID